MAESGEKLVRRTSSACGSQACVEVVGDEHGVLVRNSGEPDGPCLRFGPADWRAFLAGVRGETLLPTALNTGSKVGARGET